MATKLREVLQLFEKTRGPLSLNDMALELGIPPGMLQGMLDYWVRKGKIRECGGESACAACGCARTCSYVPNMPRRYELVADHASQSD